MSTRSIVTTTAALLLAGAAVAAPAQAFPSSWWAEETYVCSAADRFGTPVPDVTVEAADPVAASFEAMMQYGPEVNTANVQCRQQ
ncbi:hypothetical protein ACFWUP_14430 [Nocardia sp. NPDC058658]|uniref:hypothetical protein n=1 Tax=Nocardia sp. NPDC058658 TaxID=3346580 RepID=UPI003664AC9C